jgi:phosphoserine phosphatase RsbU/P
VSQQEIAREQFYDALLEDDPGLLYERAPCGYLSTTADGRIVKVNQTFLTWTGFDRQDLLDRSFVDLLTPGGRLYHETHYAPMLRLQGMVREIALDIVRSDGRRLPVLLNANLETDEEGRPAVVRIAVFDATERREYERELLRAKERAEASERRARELAHTLQQTLLPPTPPAIPGLELATVFRAAGEGVEVGGDFYDVFPVAEDDWVLVLGDVCGKGVGAAAISALARHTLRAVVVGLHAPSQALRALNEVLIGHETDRFCTVLMVRLQRRPGGWVASIASGGHPWPLLTSPGRPARLEGGTGPLVGVIADARYDDRRLDLGPGDSLLLYTDGVTEARRGREFYGDDRLRDRVGVGGRPPQAVVDDVLADVVAFSGGMPRDDIAIVAFRVP